MLNIRRLNGLQWALMGLLVTAGSAWGAPRERSLFDYGWRFHLGDIPACENPDFNDAQWSAIDLPHDWSIAGPFNQAAPAGGAGGYLPGGVGWYRKTFRVPESMQARKVSIEFDGVYQDSRVWINGRLLGERPFGYISFAYDLTPYLNFGAKDNVIAVRADNSLQPNSRWYSGSGIFRNVWLVATDPLHVGHWGTYVTSPQVSADSALVQIKTQIANDGPNRANFVLVSSILDTDGKVLATVQAPGDVAAGAGQEIAQQMTLPKPSLWSVDHPYMYAVRSSLRHEGEIVDEYDTPLGIRSIVWDVDKGFLLNGQHVKLNGVCLHHDGGSVGAAVPVGVWERRLTTLRQMGCNAIRTSHNPPAPEFLDLCDRMGFLVMDEAFDEWVSGKGQIQYGYHLHFADWWRRDVTDMVQRDRNHPSVVIWSAGNEVPDQLSPHGTGILKGLVDLFHGIDPTRPVTVACDHAYSEPQSASPEFMGLQDVAGYNYVDRWRDRKEKYFTIDRQAFPTRKFIGTEDGAMGGTRGDYAGLFSNPAPAVTPAVTPVAAPGGRGRGGRGFGFGFGFAAGRTLDVEQLWKFVSTYDYVTGDFMWTGIDYLGESFWPSKNSSSGVLDTCGFRKDGFYFYQSQWTTAPMVHLFPHWNWKGKEGQFVAVKCYTNCDTVELFLNGKSVGIKGYAFPRLGMEDRYGNSPARALRTTSDLHLEWDVPYEPGTLKAVGTKDGKAVVTEEIVTTGQAAAIGLTVDRATIADNRQDVADVTVQIVDDQGRMVPTADDEVTFEIHGPGRIIGVDNGNPMSHEDYQANHRLAFNGMCLVIVQATDEPGTIQLTASGKGLKSAAVQIQSHGNP